MTSTEIEKLIEECDAGELPTDLGVHRVNLEVAYQLAILNEQIGGVLNSRIPQLRVMIENGDYPISTKEVR